jgi:hypothetical protein
LILLSSLEIEKNTFARLFEVKKTKSLTQLEAYMQQVLPNFLHNEGEDTFVEQEFEPIVLAHEEELSVEDEALLFDNNSTLTTITTTLPWDFPAQNIVDARELAELELEAATFSHPLNPEVDWETIEAALDTEEAAHTVSEVLLPSPHPADSLVERMRPLAQQYNAAIFQNSSGVPINTGPGWQWQSVIELIDETE